MFRPQIRLYLEAERKKLVSFSANQIPIDARQNMTRQEVEISGELSTA